LKNTSGPGSKKTAELKKQLEVAELQFRLTELQSRLADAQSRAPYSSSNLPIESPQKYGEFEDLKDDEEEDLRRSLSGKNPLTIEAKIRIEIGKWADARLEEGRRFARLVRCGRPPEGLRAEFPTLFAEVIDRLPAVSRDHLFEDVQRRFMTGPDLMHWIADVKQLRKLTLAGYRKEYRRESGMARKHRPANAGQSNRHS
jgi:hypothetical protein